MKRFLRIAFLFIVLLCFVTSVNAATEEEVIEHVSKYYTIDGKQYRVEDVYINRLKEIFKEKEISSDKAQRIIDDFDQAVAIMQAGKQADPTKLSKADRQALLDLGKDAALQLDIKATYSDGKLYLVGLDGTEYPPVDVKTALEGTGKLKATGNDYTVYVAISGLALIAISVVGYRKLKINA